MDNGARVYSADAEAHAGERPSGGHHRHHTGLEALTEAVVPLGDEIKKMRLRLKKQEGMSLSPNSTFGRRWDIATMIALLFTAIVTPLEVAFEAPSPTWGLLFVINRVVDVIFGFDIVFNFFFAYRDDRIGGVLVRNQRLIAKHYIKGMFIVDVLSVVPFEFLGLRRLKAFRLVRLLRLLKLVRVLRASRVLAKYETSVSLSFAQRDMLKMGVLVLIVAHWSACVWGLADSSVRDSDDLETQTWVTAAAEAKGMDETSVHDRYVVALYFSFYTLTSIGYGDITAANITEVYACCFIMVFGSVFWAYVIGNFCSIVSSSDVFGIEFRQRMDELNRMMRERRFHPQLAQRCRLYYVESKEMKRVLNYRRLEEEMSTAMRGEVAIACNRAWLDRVWYLKAAPPAFIVEISQCLQPMTFAPMEPIQFEQTLFIVRRGIVAKLGKPLSSGAVWGQDFVVDDIGLSDSANASALTFVEVLALSRKALMEVLENDAYDEERDLVHRACVWYRMRAFLIARGRALKASRGEAGADSKRGFGELERGRQPSRLTRRAHQMATAITASDALREAAAAAEATEARHRGSRGSRDASPISDGAARQLAQRLDHVEAQGARVEAQLARVIAMLEGGSGATAPRPGSSGTLHSPMRSSPLPPLTTGSRPQSAKQPSQLEISP